MVDGTVLNIHISRPVNEDAWQGGFIRNAEGEINVRPHILASGRGRTGYRRAADAPVAGRSL